MLYVGLLLKMILALLVFCLIKRKYDGHLIYSFSWLFSYALIISGMIVLSFFKALYDTSLILYLLIIIFILLLINFSRSNSLIGNHKVDLKKSIKGLCFNLLPLIVLCTFFIFLVIRNLNYFDTTDDALTQGMTKLAFIQQHATLFAYYDSWTINIFSNEWLGELNGLFYLILTGDDRMVLMGNTEIFLFIIICLLGLIKTFHYKGNQIILLISYFSTLPVITGLAMTLKTDLISIILLPLSIVTILEYIKKETSFLLFASISVLGALTSAKITLVPLGGLLSISLIIYYFTKASQKKVFPVIGGICTAFIFCMRYIANIFYYGNPFQRSLNEKIDISINNLFENIIGIISRFTETHSYLSTIKPYSSSNWVLNKGIGYGGEIFLLLFPICILLYFIHNKRHLFLGKINYVAVPYLGAFIFVLLGTKWYPWSFRYYFPYIFILIILCVIKLLKYLDNICLKKAKLCLSVIYIILFFITCANAISAFRYGQAIPISYEATKELSDTEKKLLWSSIPKYADLKDIDSLMVLFKHGGTGIVLDEFSVPFYEFFGDDNCIYIDLAKYESQLLDNFERYDFIAVASVDYNGDLYPNLEIEMYKAGYQKYIGSYGAVFIKNDDK